MEKTRWNIVIECEAEHHRSIHDLFAIKWEYGHKKGFRIPLDNIIGVMRCDPIIEDGK